MPIHEPLEYMKWVTNNVDTLVKNEKNVVACVYCIEIYETTCLHSVHNCLVCKKCGVDAVMVVEHSPLNGLTEQEQKVLLEKWHVDGFESE
jgi:hypothetical protein